MYKKIILISIVALIILIVISVWLSGSSQPETNNDDDFLNNQEETITKREPFAEPRTPPLGEIEYRNEFHRFQILYPDDMVITEEKVAAGTSLLTFESSTDNKSFQIFIIPHGDTYITEHRLKEDLPSSIIESKEEVELAGAKGVAFISSDPSIGPTREIWFIKNGFLYEITTFKDNEVWLSEILTTWMFL